MRYLDVEKYTVKNYNDFVWKLALYDIEGVDLQIDPSICVIRVVDL